MAKKIRPTNAFSTLNVDEKKKQISADVKKTSAEQAQTIADSTILLNEVKRIDPDVVSKLENYDNLKNENLSLIKEKEDLLERIENYILEIDELKSNDKKTDDSALVDEKNNEIESLKTKIQELTDEIENLKAINDNYLIRISDLSFENASMTSKLNDITSQNSENTVLERPAIVPNEVILHNSIANHMPKNNGYDSWN